MHSEIGHCTQLYVINSIELSIYEIFFTLLLEVLFCRRTTPWLRMGGVCVSSSVLSERNHSKHNFVFIIINKSKHTNGNLFVRRFWACCANFQLDLPSKVIWYELNWIGANRTVIDAIALHYHEVGQLTEKAFNWNSRDAMDMVIALRFRLFHYFHTNMSGVHGSSTYFIIDRQWLHKMLEEVFFDFNVKWCDFCNKMWYNFTIVPYWLHFCAFNWIYARNVVHYNGFDWRKKNCPTEFLCVKNFLYAVLTE